MAERKLPIGIQSFEKLREDNYLYVDKTEYIWNLVQNGTVYFLSRPRRFGKSLLTSTLEAYFLGKKELFKGLYIEKQEKDWITYPVIHIDFTGGEYQSETGLNDMLANTLKNIIRQYDLSGEYAAEGNDIVITLSNVIQQIYRKTGKQVVVLVDEYDKPLLETMEVNEEQEEKNKQLFKSFFSVLKGMDPFLKFIFFTGVTQFSHVSVFSDLNQLNDISLNDRFSAICGITEEEMLKTFLPEIKEMAEANEQTEEECIEELARMYDGYHFSRKGTAVYNPFSILNAFFNLNYGQYWFKTGTPTFLIQRLYRTELNAEQFTEGVSVTEGMLLNYIGDEPDPIPLLYQAGYLTISSYNRKLQKYLLKFPNEEVRQGFYESLVPSVLGEETITTSNELDQMIINLDEGKIDQCMNALEALFAGIPYIEGDRPVYEQEWRNEIYLVFAMLERGTQSEVHTSKGRADCIVETDKYIYLFEFKVDKSAEEALKQIEEKVYSDKYKANQRKLYQIGVNFSSETRNIEKYLVKEKKG